MNNRTNLKLTEKNFKHLSGLESIRKRPGMYVGNTNDVLSLWCIWRETADNCVDEANAGRCTECHLVADEDGSFWTFDNGHGIPTGNMTIEAYGNKIKMPVVIATTSVLHTGGKFQENTEDSAYANTVGVHGIGIKATNALSREFEFWTNQRGRWYHASFVKGVQKTELKATTPPTLPYGIQPYKHGFIVRFKPDFSIFTVRSIDMKLVHSWAELATYFTPNFTVKVTDKHGTSTYFSKDGIRDYLEKEMQEINATCLEKSEILSVSGKGFDLAMAFTDHDEPYLKGYTNGMHNAKAGIHVNTCYRIVQDVLSGYKLAKHKFIASDLREGLVGAVNVKIASPQFSSQTKEELTDKKAEKLLQEALYEHVERFFKKNKGLARVLCDRAHSLRVLKNKQREERQAIAKTTTKRGRSPLPPKLTISTTKEPSDRELFICLSGDMRVLLTDGSSKAIKDMVGKEYYGFGINIDTGRIEPVRLKNIRKTGTDKSLVRVVTGNLGTIDCTEDHRIVVKSKKPRQVGAGITLEYVEAINLKPGMALANLSLRKTPTNQLFFYQPSEEYIKESVHWAVYNKFVGRVPVHIPHIIHHKDFNITNNVPSNLTVMKKDEYFMMRRANKDRITYNKDVAVENKNIYYEVLAVQRIAGKHDVYCLEAEGLGNFALESGVFVKNCEGDSAGGGAKLARDSSFQEVLPIKGNIINAFKAPVSKVLESDEAVAILQAIGYDLSLGKDAINNVRVGKIVFLSDEDASGGHISCLNASLLYKLAPELFERGMVYVVHGYEYLVQHKGEIVFGNSVEEIAKKVGHKKEYMERLLHLKGLGEMDPPALRQMAFDPKHRKLVRLVITDKNDTKHFENLLGEDVAYRKEWLGL